MKYKIENIFNSNHSLQCRLDILDVFINLRPASRLIVKKINEAEQLAKLLIGLNGYVKVGKNSFNQTTNSNGYVDYIDTNYNFSNTNEIYVSLYFSMNEKNVKTAYKSDFSADDVIFGKSLGYPECCISKVESLGKVPALEKSFNLYANNKEYEPLTWPVAAISDSALLPHFPCSFDCEKSIKISKTRLKYINKYCKKKEILRIFNALTSDYYIDENGIINAKKILGKKKYKTFAIPTRELSLNLDMSSINF
jgi:hypothetical protein